MSRWDLASKIEHQVARLITQQEINGVKFDIEKAERYVQQLSSERDELYKKVRPSLSMEVVSPYTNPINNPFLKSGEYNASVKNWYSEGIPDIGGPFSRICFVEPDLGSRQKLTKQLLRHGWQPEFFTEKGSPKLTVKGLPVPSLERLDGEVGGHIARWFTLGHRQSQVQGWLNNPRLKVDGRITAGANPCGTNTGRMRHRTVVNVPKAEDSVIFGKEMRSLFIPRHGYAMVGHDASGLENRMLAHYMDDEELSKEIIEGDFHTKVWDTIKEYVHSRSNTKNIEYALT